MTVDGPDDAAPAGLMGRLRCRAALAGEVGSERRAAAAAVEAAWIDASDVEPTGGAGSGGGFSVGRASGHEREEGTPPSDAEPAGAAPELSASARSRSPSLLCVCVCVCPQSR